MAWPTRRRRRLASFAPSKSALRVSLGGGPWFMPLPGSGSDPGCVGPALEINSASTVDREDLAGHEGRIEEEIFYRAGHVVRAADALQGRLLGDAALLRGREVLVPVGPEDRAGCDAVHAHLGP